MRVIFGKHKGDKRGIALPVEANYQNPLTETCLVCGATRKVWPRGGSEGHTRWEQAGIPYPDCLREEKK